MRKVSAMLLVSAVVAGLYLTSLYNYLLFHSLAELFSVVIAFGIFMVAWNSRGFIGNNYLLFLGIAYFFAGVFDLGHTLAYKGMNIFSMPGANLATQLWIAGRFTQGVSLLIAPTLMRTRIRPVPVFVIYVAATAAILVSIFGYDIFPVCFVEGSGLTGFKVVSEYMIITILIAAIFALISRQEAFDRSVLRLVEASIICAVASELLFTFYVDVYDLSNLIGHYFKLVSYYLIYRAMIKTGLEKPYSIILRDLKQSEEKLLAEKNRAETYLNIAGVLFVVIDVSEKVVLINRRGCEMLGCDGASAAGSNWFDTFVPERSRKGERLFFSQFFSGRSDGIEYRESAVLTREGKQRVIAWHYTLLRDEAEKIMGLVSSGEDITDRIEYERALEEYQGKLEQLVQYRTRELERTNDQLIAVSKKLAEAENIERQRISRELHDLVGQNLTALGLNLNIMRSKLSQKELDALEDRIADSLSLVEDTTMSVRDVMAQLRPPVLDDYGLFAAVRWYAAQFRERTGVRVDVVGEDLFPRPDMHTETSLFRIIQEALNNVVKHSGATGVAIVLKGSDDGVTLIVEDNGVGFDREEMSRSKTTGKWGLANISERAMSIGGNCMIESVPGKGTRIVVEVRP